MSTLPIGIFDSGVGGLTVYNALKTLMPHENYLYLGDTARVPYGIKTKETIIRYTLQAVKQLINTKIKYLVIACNTATGAALPLLREAYPELPMIGVIEPGTQAALSASKSGHIAVIATPSTIRMKEYEKAILAKKPQAKIFSKATPLFVALAEEGLVEGDIPERVAHYYLNEWLSLSPRTSPDTLILGCTHFPPLASAIYKVIDNKMHLVDSALNTAQSVAQYFAEHSDLKHQIEKGSSTFWVTDGVERFMQVAHIFLKERIHPKQIHLIDLA